MSTLKTNTIQASTGTRVNVASGHVLSAPGHIVQLVEKQDKAIVALLTAY